ncbi:MAG: polysaccharide lyase family 8 super-sandwich domain-containing protein, partial [bacterium]
MKKKNRFSPVLCAVFALLIGPAAVGDDIDTLFLRLRADQLTSSVSGADEYLANQRADGSWADVDYTDQSLTNWKPVTHLRRLRSMAVAYNLGSNPKHNSASMRQGIYKGLDYWYATKPLSENWWYNDIGQQLELAPILISMREDLSSAQLETGCLYLNDPRSTGQNLVWYATQTVQRGCLKHSLDDINRGLDAIKGEVRLTTEEGIQPDFSFYQHGPQLYNGGYGRRFVNDICYWIDMSSGLSFAFTDEKVSIFSSFVLDGTQWMVRRGHLDMACQGREISRPNSGSAESFASALSRMARSETANASLFGAFLDHINGSNDANLVGNKHFWRADYLAHRRPQYHTSVKMCSDRTTGTEYMNCENKKAYYFPFGATAIMCTGDEYHNIYPIWDWARIPGITCPYKTPPPQMETYIKGTTSFVGGVSNGVYGVAGMDLVWDGVTGRKAWFYFDNEFVALGAGITSRTGENVI